MKELFIVLSSILIFCGYLIYEWSIIVGKTKPHRTTRFVLFLITALGAASLLAQKSDAAFWLLAICAIHGLVVFLLSLKYGVGGWAKTDIICLLIALFGIVIWKMTGSPALALYTAISADFVGMIPSLIKTYRLPHTEYWLSYIFDIGASVFTLLAIRLWQPSEYSYPLYIIIINIFMIFLIFRPKFIHKFS